MKRIVVASLGALAACACIVCVVFFQAIVSGCFGWECAPERTFRVLDLDLPGDLFPKGATISSFHRLSEGAGTLENGLQSAYWGNRGLGTANYEVLRFPSAKQATEIFSLERKIFVDNTTKAPWTKPSAITFIGLRADEFFIGCGNWSDFRCGMIARYDEYILKFNAVIDSEMTFQRFEDLVIYMDRQILGHLSP